MDETYKRDLQKRPTKETVQRDLEKRPREEGVRTISYLNSFAHLQQTLTPLALVVPGNPKKSKIDVDLRKESPVCQTL